MFHIFLSAIFPKLAVGFYCFSAWSLVILFCWTICTTAREGIVRLKRLHQIPCSRCAFFTNDYRLKCTVDPLNALSENAIACRDFELDRPRTERKQKLNSFPEKVF